MCRSDEECVRQCLDGEPSAYRHLVERHQHAVQSYLAARVGDPQLAEEIAQEAFVRAYFSLSKLRSRASFLPWLLGIAHRAGQELIRSRTRASTAGDLSDVPAPSQKGADDLPLVEAVDRLPGVYREAILLRYHAGLSCAQMAERLGLPVGSVTKRLSRAYAMLREDLDSTGQRLRRDEAQP